MERVDVAIIGSGIIGLAVAEKLSSKFSVVVLEKESSFGQHTSSRNSEVIHSGIYYPQNSLKAKLCVRGNSLLYEFLKKHKIGYRKCGKLIVSSKLSETKKLDELICSGESNGVEGIKFLFFSEIKEKESRIIPNVSLFVPSTGIFDSHTTMKVLEFLAKEKGTMFAYNTELSSIEKETDCYKLTTNDDFSFKSDIVINSAGLWSDNVSKMVGIDKYEIQYCKGQYYKTNKIKNMKHLVYPLPDRHSLGIHTKMDLNGNISFGPNAYFVDKVDYNVENKYKQQCLESANKIFKRKFKDLSEDYAGIRPKLKDSNDFVINEDFPGFINLVGIESPGLTCCLSIAEYVEKMI